MSKFQEIADWLSGCPQLATLWNISAEPVNGTNVILPFGTSQRRSINDYQDVTGAYNATLKPLPSVYEEYQINCYREFAENQNELNALSAYDVQAICDWIIEQDEKGNLPKLTGKTVIAAEPYPFIPQIRGVDPENKLIVYYLTLRITYINTARRRSVQHYEE